MSDERARLFVALELPQAVQNALVTWSTGVLAGRSGLRPIAADALHVTLCFLGWRSVTDVEPIASACSVVAGLPVAELALGDATWLPPRRPRVLAVSLSDRGEALAAVQSALSGTLHAGGWYEPESRPFLAHVTVARVAKGVRVRREELRAPEAMRVVGSTVTLFRSRLGGGGARYEALASVSLCKVR